MQQPTSDSLARIICERSGAYHNTFFAHATTCQAIPVDQLRFLCRNWYEITKNFGLSLTLYPPVLARSILAEPQARRRQQLEEALLQVVRISSNDLGLGLGQFQNPTGVRGIHYKLFADMVKPIMSERELEQSSAHPLLSAETRAITKSLWQMFAMLTGGAAALRVVEETAFNIVSAFLSLFLAAEHNSNRVFTKEDLLYITLHLKIEQQHAVQSTDIASLVGQNRATRRQIEEEALQLARLFTAFWTVMDQETFRGKGT